MRKDSWSAEEDKLMAQTVLEFVKENKSQLEAFEEVSKKLKRTKSAIAFRWNSKIRKEFSKDLKKVKKSKEKITAYSKNSPALKEHTKAVTNKPKEAVTINTKEDLIDNIITLLQQVKREENASSVRLTTNVSEENVILKEEITKLKEEKKILRHRCKELEKQCVSLYEDYTVLMDFVDKLKRMEKKELNLVN